MPLLLNGNTLGPVKIGKQLISVRNTCAFDSAVQSMLAALHDFATYSEFLHCASFSLSKYICNLSRTGVTTNLYKERGCILSATKHIIDGVLDCSINISYLLEKFILRDIRSLEKTIRCSDCLSKIIPVLHLDPVPFYKIGMPGLYEAVDNACKTRSTNL